MRILRKVTPTAEQLKILADIKPGYRIIRGAAGSGKTTTALLRLREQVKVRLTRRERHGHDSPVRVLVLTFNRTLAGYITELAHDAASGDDGLELSVLTFAQWARGLMGNVEIAQDNEISRMLRPHTQALPTSLQHEFLSHEIQYILGRFKYDPHAFEPTSLEEYLTVVREGRGAAPRVTRAVREKLIEHAIPGYTDTKKQRGLIDWSDLAVLAANAQPNTQYDVVIIDEAQDFSANQIRAILAHLDKSHNTTFVLDAVQRIYPQYFKWAEVGIKARPEIMFRLAENHRNTAAIAAFAHPLVDDLPPDDDGTLPDFSACHRVGTKPVVVTGKYSAQLQIMFDRLEQEADMCNESVALLQPLGGRWFEEARRTLQQRCIPYSELTRKKEWPTGSEVVALCTIHSAKGLEFDHVLLPGLNQQVTPHGPEAGDSDRERLRRMLAMAICRARESVMVGYKPGEESSLVNLLDPSTYELIEA